MVIKQFLLLALYESLKVDVCLQHKHDSVSNSLVVVDSATQGSVLHLHYISTPHLTELTVVVMLSCYHNAPRLVCSSMDFYPRESADYKNVHKNMHVSTHTHHTYTHTPHAYTQTTRIHTCTHTHAPTHTQSVSLQEINTQYTDTHTHTHTHNTHTLKL